MPRRTHTCSTPRACSSRAAAAPRRRRCRGTGGPTRAASSSTFGVTVCARTEPSKHRRDLGGLGDAHRLEHGDDTGLLGGGQQPAHDVGVEVGVDDEGVGPAEQGRHDREVGDGQLVGGAHVGHRDEEVAPLVEHRGIRAGGVHGGARRGGTRRRRHWCGASTVSAAGSSPTAATRSVGLPSRARFSAMLRPTPPTVHEAVPGLLVPSTGAAGGAHLGVEHGTADDDDRVGLGAQRGSPGRGRRPSS